MAITLVVPVYKIKEEYLRKCLDSIQNQTSSEWIAILVDDGSPDYCGDICDEYAFKDRRFISVHQKNQGVSIARNRGIDDTKSEWVTFVDPDDWLDLEMVEHVNEALKQNNPDILAFAYAREFEKSSKAEKLLSESRKVDSDLLHQIRLAPLNRLIINGYIYQYSINAIWNKVYRLDFLNRHNIRFEAEARKGQDRIFNMYALDKTDDIFYLNLLLYHYRNDNEDSIVNRFNLNTVKNSQIAIALMRKWIHENNKGDQYVDMMNCWICTRVQEYMRLYYFNKKQNKPYSEIKIELDGLLEQEVYKQAFRKINSKLLSSEEKIFIFIVNKKLYRICKILILLREMKKRVRVT